MKLKTSNILALLALFLLIPLFSYAEVYETETLPVTSLLLEDAYRHLTAGEVEIAEQLYRQVLASDSTNLDAMEGLFSILSGQKNYKSIIDDIHRYGFKSVSASLWEAYAGYMTADYTGSLAKYSEVLRQEPENIAALTGLGWNYAGLGYNHYAHSLFDRALTFNRENPSASEGLSYTKQAASFFYAQLAWLDRADIKANPSCYLHFSRLNYQLILLYDYFEKEYQEGLVFSRSSFTKGLRFHFSHFTTGFNAFYLTSSEQFMYDGQGGLFIFQGHTLMPFFLLDYGFTAGMSRYKIGNTKQGELFGNLHFNSWSLRPSVIFISFADASGINPAEEPEKLVYSLSADYYVNKEITLRFLTGIGEKMLMMNKNGLITDKYTDLPKWDADVSCVFRRDSYLAFLGMKYDEREALTFYGGIGVTIRNYR